MTDPPRLVAELVGHGWTVVGQGRDHIRLAWPNRRSGFLVVPTDTTAPEFVEMWGYVLAELEAAVDVGVKAAHALAGQVSGTAQGEAGR